VVFLFVWQHSLLQQHVQFLKQSLNVLPHHYEGQDSNRGTLVYFLVNALDVLGELHQIKNKSQIIDFIYSLQILPPKNSSLQHETVHRWGWRGSPFLGLPYCCDTEGLEEDSRSKLDCSHIAMTYTALCALATLGDDYSRVNKKAIITALSHLQMPNGSFSPVCEGSESDMRFIYCGAAISYLLQDWSGFDIDSAIAYILSSQSYDYALGQGPHQESHGGSTYCGLATLVLIGSLSELPHKEELVHWLIDRQITGFQGRINKDPDTCYSFWIGSSLKLLDRLDLVNDELCKGFTRSSQQSYGGVGKNPEVVSDPLHTYMSFCGLSMLNEPGFEEINCAVGMTRRAFESISGGRKFVTGREWQQLHSL